MNQMDFVKIQRELDYYKKFIPVNYRDEREKFFAHINKAEPYNPQFIYHDKLDVKDYGTIKESLMQAGGRDEITNEFIKVYIDVADMMIAWKQNDYANLSIISGKIFGSANRFDISKTIREYKKLHARTPGPEELLNHQQIGKKFLEEFKKRNLNNWFIEYQEASGGNVSIYESEKKVVIRTGATETKIGLECALTHELDGHAIQAFNAMSSESHRKWLMSYLGTEKQYEGYATFVVLNKLSIPHILSELEYNFVLIVATSQAQRLSFYETYQRIYELCSDKNFSFLAAHKAKRGFQDTSKPGCFQKENAYLLGALEIMKLVEESKENYYRLSQGCFPLSCVRQITSRRPQWISVTDFNKENLEYFKSKMNLIIKNSV